MGNFQLRLFLRQTVLISMPTLLGYGISTAVILVWLSNRENNSLTRAGFETDMLFYRYGYTPMYGFSFDDFIKTVPSIILVSVVSLSGVLMMSFAPRCFSGRKFQSLSVAENHCICRLWKVVICEPKQTGFRWFTIFFFLGFAGAWFGVLVDNLIASVRPDTLTIAGKTYYGINTMPTPVIGWFTWSDGSFIALGILFTTYFMIVRPARKRFARSKYIVKRWCRSCGYPIAGARRCPECGAETAHS